jgi:hypothetical protein
LLREVEEAAEEEELNGFDAVLCDVPANPFWFDVIAGRLFFGPFLALFLATLVEAFDDFALCGRRDQL